MCNKTIIEFLQQSRPSYQVIKQITFLHLSLQMKPEDGSYLRLLLTTRLADEHYSVDSVVFKMRLCFLQQDCICGSYNQIFC